MKKIELWSTIFFRSGSKPNMIVMYTFFLPPLTVL